MSDVIYLSDVFASFPHIVDPQERKNEQTGKVKYSYNVDLLMSPDHPGFKQFMAAYAQLALDKGKDNAKMIMQMIEGDRKSRCFGKGEERINKKTFQPYEGYSGRVYITAGKDRPPQVIQANGLPVDQNDNFAYRQVAGKIYGGCRVNVAVKPWWQNPNPSQQYGHGIRCDLIAIQFLADSPAFGAKETDAAGLFGVVTNSEPKQPNDNMPAAPFDNNFPSFLST